MKIAINKCFGGFGLSPKAIKRIAELQGKECYFFKSKASSFRDKIPATLEEAETAFIFYAFDTPTPPKENEAKAWMEMSSEERQQWNAEYQSHCLEKFRDYEKRTDPFLIQAIEELGKEASGHCGKVEVIEIPDGIEYEIDDYDGIETVREAHRSWS
jgi:hypothetical protein